MKTTRNFFAALAFMLFPMITFPLEGIITVHQAPIYLAPSEGEKILQYVSKGTRIVVNAQDLRSPQHSSYYRVLTRDGREGHIFKKFVKVIYQDDREFRDSISPFKIDPTDYRPNEPLIEGYPIAQPNQQQGLINISFGDSYKLTYPYLKTIERESYQTRFGLGLTYLRDISFDRSRRFHFGLWASIYFHGHDIHFANSTSASESLSEYGIGPLLIYDLYQGTYYGVSIGGGAQFNYYSFSVEQESAPKIEKREFNGLGLTPKMSLTLNRKKIFPDQNAQIGLGAEIHVPLVFSLTSSEDTNELDRNFWNINNDQVKSGTQAVLSVFLNFQNQF